VRPLEGRALVERPARLQYSFDAAAMRMDDHPHRSPRFLSHVANEQKAALLPED